MKTMGRTREEGPQEREAEQDYVTYLILPKVDVEA